MVANVWQQSVGDLIYGWDFASSKDVQVFGYLVHKWWLKQEADQRTGASSSVMKVLFWFVVVQKELKWEAKLQIFWSHLLSNMDRDQKNERLEKNGSEIPLTE